jgi:hypothetical protein
MAENYAKHPRSIAEIKSDRTQRCDDWSPRDALINTLRDIDTGNSKPRALIIAWYEDGPDKTISTYYSVSAAHLVEALGVLHRAAHRLNAKADG